ncbi:MAG: DUF2244 domain-containing protein [Pseudomonadota bacterium]
MAAEQNGTAGGTSPAVHVSGPNWRERHDRPVYKVTLWPNQSLTRPGLQWFMGISAGFLILPLVAISGTAVFWGLIPFLLLAFWGIWYAIRRNGLNLSMSETLWIWRDEVRVERAEPNGARLRWQAEPMKVRIQIHKDAPIEDYLTLTGSGRIIEVGAFLSPEERVSLASEIEMGITRALRT